MTNEPASGHNRIVICLFVVVLTVGIFLRLPPALFETGRQLHFISPLHPQPASLSAGLDENLYRIYLDGLIKVGITGYPGIVDEYIEHQKTVTGSFLPPVRFLYIFTAYLWRLSFGGDALVVLRQVASFFSILTLCLFGLVVWRWRGRVWSLGVVALCAFAPTQLHMSQHALIDGFFTFWATLVIWLLWENLRAPNNWRWIVCYIFALALLVLTKENSAFVWVGCVVLMIVNRWMHFGTVTRELLIATVVGPLLGAIALIFLAGGIPTLAETYYLSVTKNLTLQFAINTGDGPWHRYLIDILLVSPIVLLLAVGCVFRLRSDQEPEWFVATFIAATYLVMCNIKYGMNLRYANMWDMPLRFLAFGCLVSIVRPFARYQNLILGLVVAAICALELRDYIVLAVQYPLYELEPENLLKALHILKGR